MKHIVRKAYSDFLKEERWLNEMAARGLMLTDYSWCRYVFAEGNPGEYTYRIELLENRPTHPESVAYIRFLEENGVECVATYMRWIYLRKKSSDGPFDIYSDIVGKIQHFQRVNALWTVLMCMEFGALLCNLLVVLAFVLSADAPFPTANAVCVAILIPVEILLFRLVWLIRKMIRRLKQEKTIRE
jgi:hypothetical protein